MSLILRAHVAAAAHQVIPVWPLHSFIAVNPLAGHESEHFDSVTDSPHRLTRDRAAYAADLARGRITAEDLAAALCERIPEIATAAISVGTNEVAATHIAVLDMTDAEWESPTAASHSLSWLDEYLSMWLAAFVNPHPIWPMPHKTEGFYGAWRQLAVRDPSLPRAARRILVGLPEQPDAGLAWALAQLGALPKSAKGLFRDELAFLPGWVGHIKWRAEKIGDIDLVSYLAVRLVLRSLLRLPAQLVAPSGGGDGQTETVRLRAERIAAKLTSGQPNKTDIAAVARILAHHPVPEHRFTWQKAFEIHYRTSVLESLNSTIESDAQPSTQVVMCIDPRSEGMRRHLEANEGIETVGFAGFFGVPVRFARFNARGAINSLPALLSARHSITELPTNDMLGQQQVARGRGRAAFRQALHVSDSSTVTPFAFAETTGWLFGISSALRTFAPTAHARLHRALVAGTEPISTTVTVDEAFTLEERARIAETGIRMMGLTQFAPLVVLAGHSSESMNNLYQSALDCGACGGNPGAANARAAAAIFNDLDVRDLLHERGIDIPAGSLFVAADHNTVSDVMSILDSHLIPSTHHDLLRQFGERQVAAANHLVRERATDLPGAAAGQRSKKLRARAHDWAEVYPELGLAGNAAMIVGPRRITRNVNLKRRVFLHSYETALDPDGTALESIMTAPLVVAQWINHQYYFSALNPATLGAGTKTVHNALDTIGVISGHSGDLRQGLPWQSLAAGNDLLHEPMRLTVIAEAPLARLGEVISRNLVLRNLLDNDWITLTARTDSDSAWNRYTPYGWTPTSTATKGQHL